MFNELTESVMLITLLVLICALLYLRTRMVERMRREQREQQGQNGGPAPDNGNAGGFPVIDERADWAVIR